ncbi:TRAP transporter small permease [Lacimicrobium alkaliphilum]|uniref:TRAP transporter small permease protein n=1 Tax=Lacimicrobium alkaliphilum TaxID=1526571 RepID=A0A0U3AF42_9ALTE|nr:TRAP transporter small permease [Lacimicrobium alkaliphilum]ALS97313.1 hypothetical protein AT746_02850 [Lacimicrobium alkaliphilum]
MKELIKWVDKCLQWTLIAAMSGILLAVSWQVLSRYLLRDPSSGMEELSRYLLIWIGLLGAAYAYRTRAHIGLNLLVSGLPPAKKKVARIAVELLVICFCAVALLYGGSHLVMLTLELEQISASLGVKVGYVYAVLPLSGALIIFYGIYHLGLLLSDHPWEDDPWK